MTQWLRIHLPMQGTRVQSLVREPRSHMVQGDRARTPQRARAVTKEACVLQRRLNTAKIQNKWKIIEWKPHNCTNKADSKQLKAQRHTGSKLEEMTLSRKKQSLHKWLQEHTQTWKTKGPEHNSYSSWKVKTIQNTYKVLKGLTMKDFLIRQTWRCRYWGRGSPRKVAWNSQCSERRLLLLLSRFSCVWPRTTP